MTAIPIRFLLPALTIQILLSTPVLAQAPSGRIAGNVVDRETGRPISGVRIAIGLNVVAQSDLQGRYRTGPLAPGPYAISAAYLGYRPEADNVQVVAGETATLNFALHSAPIQMEEITVAAPPSKPSSDAGLLSVQQSAPAVSDGVSAEAIKRAPDAAASDAVRRITGVSVFDNRFIVIRGLGERYSNSLLNGAELASPEPDKKVVPLDIFPSSLLESIVATKTATPDKPGDFAGGSVDIRTKDLPEQFILSLNFSQSYNSRSTFRSFPKPPRSGRDLFGIDGGQRTPRWDPNPERYAENFSDVWTPGNVEAAPGLGIDFALGDQKQMGNDALGFILSGTYSTKREDNPDRFSNLGAGTFNFHESNFNVDWGGIFNLIYRLGSGTQFGWRNLYTRTADETVVFNEGLSGDAEQQFTGYQMRYVERYLLQSQLTGDHEIPFLFHSRFSWKATFNRSARHEPDNRQVTYVDRGFGFAQEPARPPVRYFRDLNDDTWNGQADWEFPFHLRRPGDALFKVGGLYSHKKRDTDSQTFTYSYNPNDPNFLAVIVLPPEQVFAPENIGGALMLQLQPVPDDEFSARQIISAGYAMLDFSLLNGVRFVGGLRVEDWKVDLTVNPGTAQAFPILRRNTDYLWSGNLTVALSERMNLRFAGYRTVARPDTRELCPCAFNEVIGGVRSLGNPDLVRSVIVNGDVRWEWYPRAGEILAVSGFYKDFTDPIVSTFDAGVEGLRSHKVNATSSQLYGAEFEVRKGLAFLPGFLGWFGVGANLTLVRSTVDLPKVLGNFASDLTLEGQSSYLVNGSLVFAPPGSSISATLLVNRFGDRIYRYGVVTSPGLPQDPNYMERGRTSVDAKFRTGLFNGASLSLSARNLTGGRTEIFQLTPSGEFLRERSIPGRTFSVGLGYAF